MKTALVLAGAVAKGAFEAGVISLLQERSITIDAIVATSAGSLNAAVFATGVRFDRTRLAVEMLLSLWQERAEWMKILRPTLRGIFEHTGLSTTDALQKLVLEGMERVGAGPPSDAPKPIRLQLVTTNLNGETRGVEELATTTFEHVADFHDADFDTPAERQRVAQAALASAAFPLLFVPVNLPRVGPCVDGGAVNNTPISWALESGVERVIVVTGNPLEIPPEPQLAGAELLGKEVDIAINERLFRDLLQARKVNRKLAALKATLESLPLAPAERAEVLRVLGWKPLELIEIRPTRPLRGNAFSALSDAALRAEYIELGREAATRAVPT